VIALYYIRVRKRNFFVLCNTYNIIICEPRDRSSSAGLRGTRSGLARTVWFLSADIPRTGPINNVTTVIIVSPRRRTVISCMRLCVCVRARSFVTDTACRRRRARHPPLRLIGGVVCAGIEFPKSFRALFVVRRILASRGRTHTFRASFFSLLSSHCTTAVRAYNTIT